jgi:hypothetical protein
MSSRDKLPVNRSTRISITNGLLKRRPSSRRLTYRLRLSGEKSDSTIKATLGLSSGGYFSLLLATTVRARRVGEKWRIMCSVPSTSRSAKCRV